MPKGSPKRAELIERGGKFQVPYLVDPNTRKEMYESDEIIEYLQERYGRTRASSQRRARSKKAGARA
jgi:glutathione S-transferase